MLLRLAQRALKYQKFAFGNPSVSAEDNKENDEAANVEGGDEGVEEELDNKEMPDEEIGDVDHPKAKGEAENEEDEYVYLKKYFK